MSSKSPAEGNPSHWIADRVLRGLIGCMLLLPYRARLRLMGWVMRYVLGPVTGYLHRAEDNLKLIYPDMPAYARRRIARDCCDNFGRTFIENYSWREFGSVMSECPPEGEGMAALQEAVSAGRPVLFVSGHFGNHEAPRQSLYAAGYKVAFLYRAMQNSYFNAHYAQTMTHWGGTAFVQGRPGTKNFIQHLANGGLAALLFDVSAPGASIPFLGHPARTALSTAEFALAHDALVLPYFATRRADGIHFDVDIQSPVPHSDPVTMVTEMTSRLEAKIAEHPAQWFWVHKRWKE